MCHQTTHLNASSSVLCSISNQFPFQKHISKQRNCKKKKNSIKWDRTGWSEGGLGKSLCNWRLFFSQMGYTRLVENRETGQR